MGFRFVNYIDGYQTVYKELYASRIYPNCGKTLQILQNEMIKNNCGEIVDSSRGITFMG